MDRDKDKTWDRLDGPPNAHQRPLNPQDSRMAPPSHYTPPAPSAPHQEPPNLLGKPEPDKHPPQDVTGDMASERPETPRVKVGTPTRKSLASRTGTIKPDLPTTPMPRDEIENAKFKLNSEEHNYTKTFVRPLPPDELLDYPLLDHSKLHIDIFIASPL